MQQLISRNGAALLETWFHTRDQARTEYFLSFLTWGFIGLLEEWFRQGMALPKAELVNAAQRMADGAAAGLFSRT